jgi:hypothetical protein
VRTVGRRRRSKGTCGLANTSSCLIILPLYLHCQRCHKREIDLLQIRSDESGADLYSTCLESAPLPPPLSPPPTMCTSQPHKTAISMRRATRRRRKPRRPSHQPPPTSNPANQTRQQKSANHPVYLPDQKAHGQSVQSLFLQRQLLPSSHQEAKAMLSVKRLIDGERF